MSGTKQGGMKAAAKNLANNPNFYRDIGKIGGSNGTTGGFAHQGACNGSCGLSKRLGKKHRKAQCAGYKGGVISRRYKVAE